MDRIALHLILLELSPNVYFQPPESSMMNYPCILYDRGKIVNSKANNKTYITKTSYELTVVDFSPDSILVEEVSKLPFCEHTGFYISDQLNHDTFTIYI